MTIWLLALVLLASLAGLGYRQGAVRVAFSLVGIFVGLLVAVPLGKPLGLVLKAVGVTQPVILWMLPPFIAFCLVSALFKTAAMFVHKKIEVYFKYKAGDLRLSLWERMNHRVGLCLGLLNGVAYTCLLAFVIYIFSYWTIQMDTGEGNHWSVRLLNNAGRGLQKSGFVQTARAFDKLPASYYEAADITGRLYQNSLLEARLSRYPAFLMLGERQEFQTLAADQTFAEMRVRQAPLAEVLQYDPVKQMVNNPDILRMIWGIAQPNLKDLNNYLTNGVSETFASQPIIGRWAFNARATAAEVRRARPNIAASEMQRFRRTIEALYSRMQLVIGLEGTEKKLVVKQYPKPPTQPGAALELQNLQGTWGESGARYELAVVFPEGEQKLSATLEGDRLAVTMDKNVVVFEREY
jgi:hypothetical protein